MLGVPSDRTLRIVADLDALAYQRDGLIPVVAQDARRGDVRMVAWANREALAHSLETGALTFWSRSRQALWEKGATSGNRLRVVSLHADCDGDAVLALVEPEGPSCHTGERSCFGDHTAPLGAMEALARVLDARTAQPVEGSYTNRLLSDENLRLKKLGEETAELVAALARGDAPRAREEAADLFYHALVALHAAGVDLEALLAELDARSR
jgi:phosphoribosyl-ATP pyrophosphohydrolase/phosphoribosyl-AMP cyclohydrolase